MCIKKKKLEAKKQKTCTKEEMKLAPIECLGQKNSDYKHKTCVDQMHLRIGNETDCQNSLIHSC